MSHRIQVVMKMLHRIPERSVDIAAADVVVVVPVLHGECVGEYALVCEPLGGVFD